MLYKIFLVLVIVVGVFAGGFVAAKNVSHKKVIFQNKVLNVKTINFQGKIKSVDGPVYQIEINGAVTGVKNKSLINGAIVSVRAREITDKLGNNQSYANHSVNKRSHLMPSIEDKNNINIQSGDVVMVSGILNSDGTISGAHILSRPAIAKQKPNK